MLKSPHRFPQFPQIRSEVELKLLLQEKLIILFEEIAACLLTELISILSSFYQCFVLVVSERSDKLHFVYFALLHFADFANPKYSCANLLK